MFQAGDVTLSSFLLLQLLTGPGVLVFEPVDPPVNCGLIARATEGIALDGDGLVGLGGRP